MQACTAIACAQSPRPGWREVLRVLLAAARGLAAAHAAGLVHRDFKPANVLLGRDGRVRVADFGLSAVAGAVESVDESSQGSSSSAGYGSVTQSTRERLTQTGFLVGTPAYMAPEQYTKPQVDTLADQYRFCVTLYECLYGQFPFGDQTLQLGELIERKLHAQLPRPAGTSVPECLHRVIVRGLAAEPGARWPSMDALIAALEDDPMARRRARVRSVLWSLVVGSACAALAVLIMFGAAQRSQDDPAAVCQAAAAQLAGAWDPAVKARVHQAFTATGLPHAADTFARVAATLDGYAGAWTSMSIEACEATQVRRTQSVGILGLRVACLERRRSKLQALTELLARGPDDEVVAQAVQAAQALPAVSTCADVEGLARAVPLPEDPAARAQVQAVEAQVDQLEALFEAGKYREGLARGEALLGELADLAYVPTQARAMYWVAKLRDGAGEYAAAETLARETLQLAARAKDDVLARADAFMVQGWIFWDLHRREEARQRHEQALALREQVLGPEHPLVADALATVGMTLFLSGKYAEARARQERALAIRERVLGPEHPGVAASFTAVGHLLRAMGKYEEAQARYARALVIDERVLGPEHPKLALALIGSSTVLLELGQVAEARARAERALGIWERALGKKHHNVAYALTVLAELLVRMGELDAAARHVDRAYGIWETLLDPGDGDFAVALRLRGQILLARERPAEAVAVLERALALAATINRADVQVWLAKALWAAGKDRTRTVALAREARDYFEAIGNVARRDEVAGWLGAHVIP